MIRRLRVAGAAAGAIVTFAAHKASHCAEGSGSNPRAERLARSTTIQRLQSYATMHGEVPKAQEEKLTNTFLTLARIVSPSTMRRLKVEIVNIEQIAVSFKLAKIHEVDLAAQTSEVLAGVAGAAPGEKKHMRNAIYAMSESSHTTRLVTDTGAQVELFVENSSGQATVTLVTADLTAQDAKRIEVAFRAAVLDRGGE
jgi:hypothetical protein